jgi:uncharacterized membrane protein YqiK
MTSLDTKQEPKTEDKAIATQDQSLSQQKVENTQQNQNEKPAETHEDPNWRAFREARKKDRADKEDAERRAAEKEAEAAALKAAMEAAFSKAAPAQYVNPYDQPEETEEQRIERKVNAIIEQKEKQYAREQQEREQREYPSRISRDMPDFKQVCSQEALDYLDYHYPEISRPLQRLPEGYEKWHDIYHAVKKLIPNQVNAKKDSMKADLNSQKPKSMASPAPSPTGENPRESFTDAQQRRELNWQRMQRIMKGV